MTGSARPFMDKNNEPEVQKLHSVLQNAYPYYQQTIALASDFVQDWNFSKSSGWMLKVHDKKKALFYLIPLNNMVKISMAIRESEKDTCLSNPDLAGIYDTLNNARKYSEGYALQWNITDEETFGIFRTFIGKVIQLRK